MQIIFDDKDLEELITTGRNSKYKKYTRNKKFMTALATAWMVERILFREFDGGIRITVLSLDDTHYGNKKWNPCTFYGSSSRNDDQAGTWRAWY